MYQAIKYVKIRIGRFLKQNKSDWLKGIKVLLATKS